MSSSATVKGILSRLGSSASTQRPVTSGTRGSSVEGAHDPNVGTFAVAKPLVSTERLPGRGFGTRVAPEKLETPVFLADIGVASYATDGRGHLTQSRFESVVTSASRLRDGYYGAPTIALRGGLPQRPESRLGAKGLTHRVAQIGSMIANVLIPDHKGEWHIFVPLVFEDVTYGSDCMLTEGAHSTPPPGWNVYVLMNNKYAVSSTRAPFIRVLNCYGDAYALAVRIDLSLKEVTVARDLRLAVVLEKPLSEMKLFETGLAIAGRYECEAPGRAEPWFEFYTECFDWILEPELRDFARHWLQSREADMEAPCYAESEDHPLDAKEYLHGLMTELARLGADTEYLLDALNSMSTAQAERYARELAETLFKGVPLANEAVPPGVYWSPELHEEPNEDESVVNPPLARGGANDLVFAFGTSHLVRPCQTLGQYRCAFAPELVEIEFGSAVLNQGLCTMRERQLAGCVDLDFVVANVKLDGTVRSLTTRARRTTHGLSPCGVIWHEKGNFVVNYRGVWARATASADPSTRSACLAFNSQLMAEVVFRGAQPGRLRVVPYENRNGRRLRPFVPDHFRDRASFLDSFSGSGGEVAPRPHHESDHPHAFGGGWSFGMRASAMPWVYEMLQIREHVLVDLSDTNGSVFVVIQSGGSKASFPVTYALDPSVFDPKASPTKNMQSMIASHIHPSARRSTRGSSRRGSEVDVAEVLLKQAPSNVGPTPAVMESFLKLLPDDQASALRLSMLAERPPTAAEWKVARERGPRGGSCSKRRQKPPTCVADQPPPEGEGWTLVGEEPPEEMFRRVAERLLASVDASDAGRLVGALPKAPDIQAAATLVSEARARTPMPSSWNALMSAHPFKSEAKRLTFESDLRECLLGYRSELKIEELDERVVTLFILSGPVVGIPPATRHDYRTPTSLTKKSLDERHA